MMSNEAAAFIPLFPKKHIPPVLSSIYQASVTLRKKTANDREDWITRRLYFRLIRISTFRDGPLDIRLQPEIVFHDSDADSPAGRIDLLVSCGHGYEVYFAIEAKRLRVRLSNGRLHSGSDKYVNNGMMRFVTGQYAPFMEAGAMLGYVFDGKTNLARSAVNKYVKNKAKELRLKPPKRLMRSHILQNMPLDETRHDLRKRAFIIYHIFIAV
jgi:hypothetical protein